jgi:hypothetical protein
MPIVFASLKATARRMVFANSRTLPGRIALEQFHGFIGNADLAAVEPAAKSSA